MVGETGLKEIFSTLGLLEPVNLELKEANLTQPIIPKNWQDISLATYLMDMVCLSPCYIWQKPMQYWGMEDLI